MSTPSTVKPFFSEKYHTTESITLVESNQIIDKDDCIADTFNDFFSNAVKNLILTVIQL